MAHSKTISMLKSMNDTCKDGMGLPVSAKHLASLELHVVLTAMADRSSEPRGELSVLVRHLGADPHERGPIADPLYRSLIDRKECLRAVTTRRFYKSANQAKMRQRNVTATHVRATSRPTCGPRSSANTLV